jgi:hypothetical protein
MSYEKLCKVLLGFLLLVAMTMAITLFGEARKPVTLLIKPLSTPHVEKEDVFLKQTALVPSIWAPVDFCNHSSYNGGVFATLWTIDCVRSFVPV